MSKRPLADEDGDELTPLDPKSNMAQLIHLLEYSRLKGYQVGPTIQVGDVIVQVRDLKLKVGVPGKPERTIWEENGHDGE